MFTLSLQTRQGNLTESRSLCLKDPKKVARSSDIMPTAGSWNACEVLCPHCVYDYPLTL